MSSWGWVDRGLALARRRTVVRRNSPADIKWCSLCGVHQILRDDEQIVGPWNRIFHVMCPVCAGEAEDPFAIADFHLKQEVLAGADADADATAAA